MPPISHHYNPQVYLRQFVNPARKNELWEFDLRTGAAKKSKPKDCGCQDFYHSVTREDGSRDDETIEESFHALENDLPKLFECIRHSRPLSDETFAALVTFAALERARCPMAVHSIQEGMSKVHQYAFDLMKHSPSFEKAMIAQGIDPEFARKQEFEVKANRDVTLLTMLSVFQDSSLTKLLANMEWHFLVAPPGNYFFTSDNPVCCWPPPGTTGIYRSVGPSHRDVEITFRFRVVFAHLLLGSLFLPRSMPLPVCSKLTL